jgi:hypothetical protein
MTLGLLGHRRATETGDALKAVRLNPINPVRRGPESQTAGARWMIDHELEVSRARA